MAFIVLIFLLVATPLWLPSNGLAYTIVGLVSGLLVALALRARGGISDPFGSLSWIGRRSYGLYLSHGPCMAFVLELQLDVAFRTLTWLLLMLGVTEFLYRFVEQPLIVVGRTRAASIESASKSTVMLLGSDKTAARK